MKDSVISVKRIDERREIKKFNSGVSELWVDGVKKSYSFSKIGKFKDDEDLKKQIAFVNIKVGENLNLSDKLLGIIDIDGNLVSPLHSVRYEEMFFGHDIDKIVDSVFRRLFIDNSLFNQKNKNAKAKMKVLAKYAQKNKLDK